MSLDWFKGNLPENPTFHCIKHGFRLSKVFPRNHTQWLFVWDKNPRACRRVLWILLVRSCIVRFVSLSRLSLGADLCPLPPPSVFIFPYVVVGPTLPTPRSTPAWLCTCCCHFDGCFLFLLCLPSGCSVASYIQHLIDWLLCRTRFTRITFLNMAFSKAFLKMAFSKTQVYTHALV